MREYPTNNAYSSEYPRTHPSITKQVDDVLIENSEASGILSAVAHARHRYSDKSPLPLRETA